VTLLAFRSRPREAGHIALISFPIRVNSSRSSISSRAADLVHSTSLARRAGHTNGPHVIGAGGVAVGAEAADRNMLIFNKII
jgi:hypothetical protein